MESRASDGCAAGANMLALIDGDILIYRVGFTTEDVPIAIACSRMDESIKNIVEATECDNFSVFLTATGHKCFRFGIFPEYKANRKQPKPYWYHELRAHLVADYGASVSEELEADDALGIAQNYNTVLCHIDKDLDQIPGKHYDFVKKVHYDVDVQRGLRFFFYQLLMGDSTDNIKGIPGVGPKTAEKLLKGLKSERDLLDACRAAYKEAKLDEEYMKLQGRLVKIRQREDETLWEPEEGVVIKMAGEADLNLLLRGSQSETVSPSSTNPSTFLTSSPRLNVSTSLIG